MSSCFTEKVKNHVFFRGGFMLLATKRSRIKTNKLVIIFVSISLLIGVSDFCFAEQEVSPQDQEEGKANVETEESSSRPCFGVWYEENCLIDNTVTALVAIGATIGFYKTISKSYCRQDRNRLGPKDGEDDRVGGRVAGPRRGFDHGILAPVTPPRWLRTSQNQQSPMFVISPLHQGPEVMGGAATPASFVVRNRLQPPPPLPASEAASSSSSSSSTPARVIHSSNVEDLFCRDPSLIDPIRESESERDAQ
jgi:hypothetical protein